MLTRRRLLHFSAAAASTLWLPRSSWSVPALGHDPFSLGVASGSPSYDSVVIWTRLMGGGFDLPFAAAFGVGDVPQEVTVRWEVAHDAAFKRLVQSGQAQALALLGHSVHVEVPSLAPDRWYFYRFMLGDAVSPVGRTRTFPLPSSKVARMRLAYASCQRWEHGYYSAYRHMAQENLDAVLFLGDYIYEYPTAARAVREPTGGWTVSLEDYRRRYALHKSDADLQAMHAACPWMLTWDDHEVQNDYAGVTEGDGYYQVGNFLNNFLARRVAAYQAYYEHMPLRASVLTQSLAGLSSGAEMRLYHETRFGQLAHFYIVDGRQYKDAQVCNSLGRHGSSVLNPAHCAAWRDPARSYLGMTQERWLEAGLARAQQDGQTWSVIGQQTLFGQRDNQSEKKSEEGSLLWNDGWDGYTAARSRLTQALQHSGAPNPVLLGGDVHENWVGHVKVDYDQPNSAVVGVEFCGTSITSRTGSDAVSKTPTRLAKNPHFVFADAKSRGYGVAEFTPKQLTTTLRVVDDVTRRDAGISTLAQFAVPAGRSVVERS